jgi:hypothetical protein
LSATLIPIIIAFGSIWVFGHELTYSTRERRFALKAYTAFAFGMVLYVFGVGCVYNYADWDEHYKFLCVTVNLSVFVFGWVIGKYLFWVVRKQLRLRKEEAGTDTTPGMFGWKQPYEWRSQRSFLGLPLMHVRFNLEIDDKTAAKGWIAIGTRAYGILFACGGVARALISFGGQAIGVFAVGGMSIGLFVFGGFALGLFATGGGAIGYVAYGGAAIAWLAAVGGHPIARYYAVGGAPLAFHANDDVAREFINNSFFFQHAENITGILILLSFVPAIAMVVANRWFKKRSGKKTSNPPPL